MRILTDILLTYGLHSILLLGAAWLLSFAFKAPPVRDTLWKNVRVATFTAPSRGTIRGCTDTPQPVAIGSTVSHFAA